jgi:hypothetical protein
MRHYSDTIHHLPGAAQKHEQHLHLPHIGRKAHVLGRREARNTLLWDQKENIQGSCQDVYEGEVRCRRAEYD